MNTDRTINCKLSENNTPIAPPQAATPSISSSTLVQKRTHGSSVKFDTPADQQQQQHPFTATREKSCSIVPPSPQELLARRVRSASRPSLFPLRSTNILDTHRRAHSTCQTEEVQVPSFPKETGSRVAFIGNYLPRKCGIANFTHDLRCAIANRYDHNRCDTPVDADVFCVNDGKEEYSYAEEVVMEFEEQSRASYARIADGINSSNVDVVCIQHEYGIYGGPCGVYLLDLMRALKVPIVTTLHTILADPSVEQRKVLGGILHYSSKVITMTDTGNRLLQTVYNAPQEKVAIVPHGIPVTDDVEDTAVFKKKLGIPTDKKMFLTFGLLSPNKGIEHMIEALPCIKQEFPEVLYVVLGQTHPNLIRESGEGYRFKLQHIAKELNVESNILFVNRYTDLPLLLDFIRACDLYVTPYLHEAQITSGTLSYAYGLGKVVVSTPYWHARDLLGKSGNGRLVDFASRRDLSREILSLLRDDELRESMSRAAYDEGRTFTWPRTAESYARVFSDAIDSYDHQSLQQNNIHHLTSSKSVDPTFAALLLGNATPCPLPRVPRSPAAPGSTGTDQPVPHASLNPEDFEAVSYEQIATYTRSSSLPDVNLTHLLRLIDDTGIIQHATFAIPNREYGYCTDDCSRTLSTLVRLKAEGQHTITENVAKAMTTMMSFLLNALDEKNCRFRNFMSYERRWVDEDGVGSQDAHGRALQALGCCVRYGFNTDLAVHLFTRAMGPTADFDSPRAIAFSLLGFCQFRERLPRNPAAAALQQRLAGKLAALFEECIAANPEHHWFERSLAYNNGALASAMMYTGVQANNTRFTDIGLQSLQWLLRKQVRESDGAFTPVGSKTFVDGSHERMVTTFDQQPIEASDMVIACISAVEVTKDPSWLHHADTIFDWFMGKNHLGAALFDPQTGGCHDGLHNDRVNMNQGAESTICYVDALACLRFAQQRFVDAQQQSQQSQMATGVCSNTTQNSTQTSMKVF